MKITGKAKVNIPFWGQMAIILGIGIVISAAILIISKNGSNNIPTNKYTVRFCTEAGRLIEAKQVTENEGVIPPEVIEQGYIFRGWSRPINNINSDTEVTPLYQKINGETNYIFYNTKYVKEGEDFEIPILLGGNIDIKSGQIIIEYDEKAFELNDVTGNAVSTYKEEDGKIIIELDTSHINETISDFINLKMYANEIDAYYTGFDISANLTNQKNNVADYATLNNKIFFIQEGE